MIEVLGLRNIVRDLCFLLFPLANCSISQQREDRDEDLNRVMKYWNASMTPDEYQRALASLAMMKESRNASMTTPSRWKSTGPTGGISPKGYNGRIAGIQIRADAGSYYIYAGASSGGLWRALASAGVGFWQSLGDGLDNPSVRAFAVHPTNPSTIIAGTGDWARYGGAGMYRTTNSGTTWDRLLLPPGTFPGAYFRILYMPGDPNILLAASEHGVLRSTNGGTNWSVPLAGFATDLVIDPSNPNIMYTAIGYDSTAPGMYKSTDGGVTWTRKPSPVGQFGRASIAICRDAPSTIAFMVEYNNYLQGVLRSTNAGETWTIITSNLLGLPTFTEDQFGHAQAIAIRPNNPDDIFVGGVKLARTTGGGSNWISMIDESFEHEDMTQLYFSDITGNDVIWVCNDGGIYKMTLTGATENWNGTSPSGLRCSQIDYLDAQREFRVMGLQDNGVLRSTSSGADWLMEISGDGFDCEITDDLNFTYFFSSGIYKAPPESPISELVDAA